MRCKRRGDFTLTWLGKDKNELITYLLLLTTYYNNTINMLA